MKKVLIISADFYPHISSMLLEGAIAVLKEEKIDYEIIRVPGVLEIPSVIAFSSCHENSNNQKNKDRNCEQFIGFIALGCVIRGETYHFEVVSNESARALQDLALSRNLAIGNGILTVENESQALRRADKNQLNKGKAAAKACLCLVGVKEKF